MAVRASRLQLLSVVLMLMAVFSVAVTVADARSLRHSYHQKHRLLHQIYHFKNWLKTFNLGKMSKVEAAEVALINSKLPSGPSPGVGNSVPVSAVPRNFQN